MSSASRSIFIQFKLIFIRFARGLVLKQRHKAARNWLLYCPLHHHHHCHRHHLLAFTRIALKPVYYDPVVYKTVTRFITLSVGIKLHENDSVPYIFSSLRSYLWYFVTICQVKNFIFQNSCQIFCSFLLSSLVRMSVRKEMALLTMHGWETMKYFIGCTLSSFFVNTDWLSCL